MLTLWTFTLSVGVAAMLPLAGCGDSDGHTGAAGDLDSEGGADAGAGAGARGSDAAANADSGRRGASDAGPSDVPPRGDAATRQDAATTDDAAPREDVVSPTDAARAGSPLELSGGVVLSEVTSEFIDIASATARFTHATPGSAGTTYGPCTVGPATLGSAAPIFGYDAGVITVSGTTPGVTLTPTQEDGNGTGYTSSLPEGTESFLPPGGALVTVSGAGGGEIGAFTMFVQMPEPITLTSPTTGLFASTSATADLQVTWNAGNGEQVVVTVSPLSSSYQPEAGDAVLCVLDGDSGSVTVPAAALQQVGTGNAAVTVTRVKTGSAEVPGFIVPTLATRSTGGPISLD